MSPALPAHPWFRRLQGHRRHLGLQSGYVSLILRLQLPRKKRRKGRETDRDRWTDWQRKQIEPGRQRGLRNTWKFRQKEGVWRSWVRVELTCWTR